MSFSISCHDLHVVENTILYINNDVSKVENLSVNFICKKFTCNIKNSSCFRIIFLIMFTRTFYFYRYTLYFSYTYTHTYQISKKTCSLYSQQAWSTVTWKFCRIFKLIKRFQYLQEWLKSSDVWRWLSGLKWEFLKFLRFWCSSTSKLAA